MQNISKKLIVAIIVLIIAIVVGGWFWYASVQERQAQEQEQAEIALNANEVWYPIPELGIKMKLNKEFAQDLMYSYEQALTVIATKDFPGNSYPERNFGIAQQHYGRVNLSLKSLLSTLSNQKDGKCLESARGALGVIEKLPKHSDGNFYPNFPLVDGNNNFDERQNELISIDEGIYGTSRTMYKKFDENNLVMWYIYPDVTECFNPKDHSPYTIDGTPTIMEYEVVVPNYQGLGSKTITDGFKDMQSL
jgi:hypothetical protein